MSDLAAELLKNYITQFYENQRSREQSFLKIVGSIGVVVAGYAYVYKEQATNTALLALSTIVAVVLLLFVALTITVVAYSYRRQQIIVARINQYAGIVGPGLPLPPDHAPEDIAQKRVHRFFWMPDIFMIYYLVFPIIQVIITISFLGRQNHAQDLPVWLTAAFCGLVILLTLAAPGWYGRKLRRKLAYR